VTVGRLRRLAVVTALLAFLPACQSAGPDPAPPDRITGPFAACPASATSTGGAPTGAERTMVLPDEPLPCLGEGAPVRLTTLGRPAVVNLWASWCAPCREELPAFQDFADRAGDRLLLLGVVTGDRRSVAAETASDLGVSFPSVFDEAKVVERALPRQGLPATLFVDGAGWVRHVYRGVPLDEAALTKLTEEHLGVTVP
jgi:thiol-disulfide isomerase/thioredoxin